MNPIEDFANIFTEHTFIVVALGSLILGAVSGTLGSFAFLRRQSLTGDVVAHSSLAGITIFFAAFYFIFGYGQKDTLFLMSGAFLSGILSMFSVDIIIRNTKIKADSAMGIMLAVFFATGIFVLSLIRNFPIEGKAGIEDFIFGMAATMTHTDLLYMGVIGLAVVITLLIFWKEIKLDSFDGEFAESLGFPRKRIGVLVNVLLVLSIVIGLHTVGVILMVSMLVAPGSAARQWTNNLATMTVLAAIFGIISGFAGTFVSATNPNIPTGPVIVLAATSIVVLSILFAPKRGLLAKLIFRIRNKRRIKFSLVLIDLYLLNMNHGLDRTSAHSSKILRIMHSRFSNIKGSLNYLRELGLVEEIGEDFWVLTNDGEAKAQEIINVQGTLL